ncbi:MAG: biotin transporter BioY [bacterium]
MHGKGRGIFSLREMSGAGLFAALTAVLGYVSIPLPFSPVPITAQTFGVMLAGSLLGAKGGSLSMILYLLIGVVGIPIFASGSGGIGVLAGPTGGYLLSYPFAAYIIGTISSFGSERTSIYKLGIANLLGGIGIIYTFGVLQLNLATNMGWESAVVSGALPFIFGDLLKVGVAVVVAHRVRTVFPVISFRSGC